MTRLFEAARGGWQSARANLIPGLVIISLAALLVAAYYTFPSVQPALEGLRAVRQTWGLAFTMLSSAVGAGLIPGLYLLAVGKARRGGRGWFDLLFTCLIWATIMILVDYFYAFQDWFWGSGVSLSLLLAKMLLDQFAFTPLLSIPYLALGFRLRDLNYNFSALGRALREDWIFKVILPMLGPCWLTWIPGTLVVYSLPLSLQVPLMVLVQCFFALEMAYVSSKITAAPVA
jgi:hypothetical protein